MAGFSCASRVETAITPSPVRSEVSAEPGRDGTRRVCPILSGDALFGAGNGVSDSVRGCAFRGRERCVRFCPGVRFSGPGTVCPILSGGALFGAGTGPGKCVRFCPIVYLFFRGRAVIAILFLESRILRAKSDTLRLDYPSPVRHPSRGTLFRSGSSGQALPVRHTCAPPFPGQALLVRHPTPSSGSGKAPTPEKRPVEALLCFSAPLSAQKPHLGL